MFLVMPSTETTTKARPNFRVSHELGDRVHRHVYRLKSEGRDVTIKSFVEDALTAALPPEPANGQRVNGAEHGGTHAA